MTVGELIRTLQRFPLTATVYCMHVYDDEESDYTDPMPYFDDIANEVLL